VSILEPRKSKPLATSGSRTSLLPLLPRDDCRSCPSQQASTMEEGEQHAGLTGRKGRPWRPFKDEREVHLLMSRAES
jgi:hypothetical protein